MKRLVKPLSVFLTVLLLMSVFAVAFSAFAATNGWVTKYYNIDGEIIKCTYYYKDGEPVTGWKKISGSWYYFDKYIYSVASEVDIWNGRMVCGEMKRTARPTEFIFCNYNYFDGKVYYFYDNGKLAEDKNGWFKFEGEWYYLKNGKALIDAQKIGGKTYVFDSMTGCMRYDEFYGTMDRTMYVLKKDGTVNTSVSGWKKYNDEWYYVDKGICRNGWSKIDGKWYFFDRDASTMVSNGIHEDNGKIYLFYKDGAWVSKSGWSKVDGKWYYLDDGIVFKGWREIDGKWRYFSPAMFENRVDRADTKKYRYYFDADGVWDKSLTGFVTAYDGQTFNREEDEPEDVTSYYRTYYVESGYVIDGWKKFDEGWRYFYPAMASSPLCAVGNTVYYFSSDGILDEDYKGWYPTADGFGNTLWFYYENGKCVKGFKTIKGKTYYFIESGPLLWEMYRMAICWQKVDGKWYYFGTDGAMRYKWQKVDGKWYYLGTDGVMVADCSKKIDGKTYKFDKKGVCLNP